MCLSAAYEIGSEGEKLICDRVTNIVVEDGNVKLTTLLGTETVVTGVLRNIDLNKNIIRIETK
ncbi:MAG: CooT family nickel-binding protein [Clostridiales bacterium]|jgi:predicted RNA-binding protein|nr:CooT family nickel-binding protein [Clostridiales bacterium]